MQTLIFCVRLETSFERRPCPRAVVHRRPMTSLNVGENIRVTNSLSDPTLYWRGFIQGARGTYIKIKNIDHTLHLILIVIFV